MGIDYGTRRLGVALSDEGGTLAFPKAIVPAGPEAPRQVAELAREEGVGEIVVGESLDFSGAANRVMAEISAFIRLLETQSGLPVRLEKEFLTSVEARRFRPEEKGKEPRRVDDAAAALILQRFLDRHNNPSALPRARKQ